MEYMIQNNGYQMNIAFWTNCAYLFEIKVVRGHRIKPNGDGTMQYKIMAIQ